MMTVYAQYSFGGYKIFRLTANAVEEVTGQNRLGLPQSAVQLFSHYGIKLLCASDIAGNFLLFVNDMPCKEKDDMGRSKTCSLVIATKDIADLPVMRRIAVMIAFELDAFESFFSSLFAIKETLSFDFCRLKKFLDSISTDTSMSNDRLRFAMVSKDNPIIVYTTTNANAALEPLYNRFEKNNLRRGFLMKWDDVTRNIKENSVGRIGFLRLLQLIINKITTIWKN